MATWFDVSRIATVLVVLITLTACASPTTIPTATPVPPPPTATSIATQTATPTPPLDPTPTSEPPTPTATAMPTPVAAESARYLLTFEATWSEITHPTDFPPNPHFSGLIGATHSEDAELWAEGETATPGIENMAETGEKSPLDSEIDALIAEGGACETISGDGIPLSPGVVTVTFTVTQDCPLLSAVSMIAPSPDWFVGVAGLRLFDEGRWIEEQIVDLYPYDAGTDSGRTYTSPDEPTAEGEAIYRIETAPLLVDGRVPPLGVFRFTRMDE